jgi:hypothetical protein
MARGRSFSTPDEDRRRDDDRNWASPAYQRPAVMPEDPAKIACARAERMFVEGKRRAGVSWFNIARMTGRTVAELQRDYG